MKLLPFRARARARARARTVIRYLFNVFTEDFINLGRITGIGSGTGAGTGTSTNGNY